MKQWTYLLTLSTLIVTQFFIHGAERSAALPSNHGTLVQAERNSTDIDFSSYISDQLGTISFSSFEDLCIQILSSDLMNGAKKAEEIAQVLLSAPKAIYTEIIPSEKLRTYLKSSSFASGPLVSQMIREFEESAQKIKEHILTTDAGQPVKVKMDKNDRVVKDDANGMQFESEQQRLAFAAQASFEDCKKALASKGNNRFTRRALQLLSMTMNDHNQKVPYLITEIKAHLKSQTFDKKLIVNLTNSPYAQDRELVLLIADLQFKIADPQSKIKPESDHDAQLRQVRHERQRKFDEKMRLEEAEKAKKEEEEHRKQVALREEAAQREREQKEQQEKDKRREEKLRQQREEEERKREEQERREADQRMAERLHEELNGGGKPPADEDADAKLARELDEAARRHRPPQGPPAEQRNGNGQAQHADENPEQRRDAPPADQDLRLQGDASQSQQREPHFNAHHEKNKNATWSIIKGMGIFSAVLATSYVANRYYQDIQEAKRKSRTRKRDEQKASQEKAPEATTP